MKLGAAFKNLNPGCPDHLWVVCSAPDQNGGAVVFNLTTHDSGSRDGSDETCVLDAGDHKFIRRKTVVAYGRGMILSQENYSKLCSLGYCGKWPDVTPAVLRRIQLGALGHDEVAPKLQALVRASLVPAPECVLEEATVEHAPRDEKDAHRKP